MDAVNQELNKLTTKKIALQNSFKEYTDANGFSYEAWVNPPAGHFFETYKKELNEINDQMAPPLAYYQS